MTKISKIFLPNILNKQLKKIFKKGSLEGEFTIPFNEDGSIGEGYGFSGKISNALNDCSYIPGINSAPLHELLPSIIANRLQEGFKTFGRKMKGYYTNEANILGVESRTSSPVRIPRDEVLLSHPQVHNLYPCGEGAGYAGGIVSAAIDGERCAEAIQKAL